MFDIQVEKYNSNEYILLNVNIQYEMDICVEEEKEQSLYQKSKKHQEEDPEKSVKEQLSKREEETIGWFHVSQG